MAWSITVAGTVHLDDVTTPHGHRPRQQGGSAVYFALVGSAFTRVHAAGIQGTDTAHHLRALFAGRDIDDLDLQVSEVPTQHWQVVHDFTRWVTASEVTLVEGCDSLWEAQLGEAARAAPVLFLASMAPRLQAEVLRRSSARLIGADSMTVHIGPERALVQDIAQSVDLLFLNRTELGTLEPGHGGDWIAAARSLIGGNRLRGVVVKAGPAGAAVVTASAVIEAAAAPVDVVIDPTGAGDALAAGFLGACARAERDDEGFFPEALDAGVRWAAVAISAFGVEGIEGAPPVPR